MRSPTPTRQSSQHNTGTWHGHDTRRTPSDDLASDVGEEFTALFAWYETFHISMLNPGQQLTLVTLPSPPHITNWHIVMHAEAVRNSRTVAIPAVVKEGPTSSRCCKRQKPQDKDTEVRGYMDELSNKTELIAPELNYRNRSPPVGQQRSAVYLVDVPFPHGQTKLCLQRNKMQNRVDHPVRTPGGHNRCARGLVPCVVRSNNRPHVQRRACCVRFSRKGGEGFVTHEEFEHAHPRLLKKTKKKTCTKIT